MGKNISPIGSTSNLVGPGWTSGANTTPVVLSMCSYEFLPQLQEYAKYTLTHSSSGKHPEGPSPYGLGGVITLVAVLAPFAICHLCVCVCVSMYVHVTDFCLCVCALSGMIP